MKSIVFRLISLLLLLMTLCTLAAAEKKENPLFESAWKQMKEITSQGKEHSKIKGSIYAVYQFGETECISTSYMGEVPTIAVTSGCSVQGNRITLTLQNNSRSGTYTIENDTLTIAWDDGAFLIFSRMPEA